MKRVIISNLFETGSLTDKMLFDDLAKRYDILGKTTNNFLQSVITGHMAPKDPNSKVEPNDEE